MQKRALNNKASLIVQKSTWLQGLQACERQYQESGIVPDAIMATHDSAIDFCSGWNCYRIYILGVNPELPSKLTKRLARIDQAYSRMVVALDYGNNSELAVLAMLQRLKQRRLSARTKAMEYYHAK